MTDPIEQFTQWLTLAKNTASITEPTAMTLATATAEGKPSARIVLLKGHDARGFVFYTNLESRKSVEIAHNPQGALCSYWMALGRQVRIEGRIEPVSAEEADIYFASRPRESRIGAWASQQSRPLESREALARAVEETTKKFEGRDVPRPDFWSGWRLIPEQMEFWQQSNFRLHDREVFSLRDGMWVYGRLYP